MQIVNNYMLGTTDSCIIDFMITTDSRYTLALVKAQEACYEATSYKENFKDAIDVRDHANADNQKTHLQPVSKFLVRAPRAIDSF